MFQECLLLLAQPYSWAGKGPPRTCFCALQQQQQQQPVVPLRSSSMESQTKTGNVFLKPHKPNKVSRRLLLCGRATLHRIPDRVLIRDDRIDLSRIQTESETMTCSKIIPVWFKPREVLELSSGFLWIYWEEFRGESRNPSRQVETDQKFLAEHSCSAPGTNFYVCGPVCVSVCVSSVPDSCLPAGHT